MRKGFIIFAIIAIAAILVFAFLTQDDSRQGWFGKSNEVVQAEQEAIKIAASQLREQQVRDYELLVRAFMELYPLTTENDVWYLVVTVLEIDYVCRVQIEALEKGE